MLSVYNEWFYSTFESGALRSARVVVPLIMDIVHPRSVVDVGCGTGTWIATFREQGVEDILGIDGDWLPTERLLIPTDCFVAHDLCQPLHSERNFDLAISLETAEH